MELISFSLPYSNLLLDITKAAARLCEPAFTCVTRLREALVYFKIFTCNVFKGSGPNEKYEPIAWCPRQFTFWISDPLKTNTSLNMIFCIPTDQEKNHIIHTFSPWTKITFLLSDPSTKMTTFTRPFYHFPNQKTQQSHGLTINKTHIFYLLTY